MGRDRTTPDVRTRLVETADRLFYADGIRAVGIDRVIAEAGVAKMSLYAHFASKDELIAAVLRHRDECVFAFFHEAVGRQAAAGPVGAVFAALREWFESPGFRGCAFINAAAELADPAHPALGVVRDHKRRFHAFVAEQVALSVGPTPYAAAVAALVDGAVVNAVIHGSPAAADTARNAAFALLGLSPAKPNRGKKS